MTANDEWTTVSSGEDVELDQETKIVFEEIGDEITGEYLGLRELRDSDTGRPYFQARFRIDGEVCFCRANHSMKEGLKTVAIGSLTRVIYAADVDTGQANPMRSFTVQVNRSTPVSAGGRPVRRASAKPAKQAAKPVKDNPQA